MRLFDCGTYALQDLDRPFRQQTLRTFEFRAQRSAGWQFHNDEWMLSLDAEVVNGKHIPMNQSGCSASFSMESRPHLSVFNEVRPNHFYGDWPESCAAIFVENVV